MQIALPISQWPSTGPPKGERLAVVPNCCLRTNGRLNTILELCSDKIITIAKKINVLHAAYMLRIYDIHHTIHITKYMA